MILLYKKNDRADPANWRPILPMNCNEKLLTRILTTRLQQNLTLMIDLSQSRFVRGRSIFDNLWTVIHNLEACKSDKVRGSLILLDQEKAYDRIDWSCLQRCMVTFGFGPFWQARIRRLYCGLQAFFYGEQLPDGVSTHYSRPAPGWSMVTTTVHVTVQLRSSQL
jgi:hypothetical protein